MAHTSLHLDDEPNVPVPSQPRHHSQWILFWAYFGIPLMLWTTAIAVSLGFTGYTVRNYAVDAARIQARTAFEKDVVYRRWISRMGGVYVPISDETPPNPYLSDDPKRDFVSPFGVAMTKINPAYMTRLIHEMGELDSGVISHITSNTPIRPQNKADAWESAALEKLERFEATEVSNVEEMDGKLYLRLIGPLVTEQSCLPCHAFQGYKEGDIRGGISVSVPLAPLVAATTIRTLVAAHAGLWGLGILAIVVTARRLRKFSRERDLTLDQLRQLTQNLENRVSERTAALRQRQLQLQSFMDNTDSGMFLKNAEGTYVLVNRQYAALLGKTTDALLGLKDADLLPPGRAARFEDVERTVMQTRFPMEIENVFFAEKGEETYDAFVFPVFGDDRKNTVDGMGGIVMNVSHRKAMEEALRAAKEAAEQANQAKSDFLANISHEIRTPLNGIIGMADLLSRSHMTEDHTAMVSTIKNSGDVLLALINDMLDFSKIEAGKMHLETFPFNLMDLIFNTARGLTAMALEKGIDLNVRIGQRLPARVVGDATRIRQIVSNLIGNAIKFTEKGEVIVSVEMLGQTAASVTIRISVMDTGIGIPEQRQKSVFDAFEQSDTSITRKYGGTGLGLPISQRLARLMDAEIRLESQVGVGSTFSFDLILPISEEPDVSQARTGMRHLASYGALVVDDSATNRAIVTGYLRAWGMTVRQAQSVDEAMACLAADESCADIVITDLRMPEKDGLTLVRAIRESGSHLPVILLPSGNLTEAETREKQYQARLEKPVRPDDLFDVICRVLKLTVNPDASSVSGTDPADSVQPPGKQLRVLLVDDVDINQAVVSRMLETMGHLTVIAGNGQEALNILKKERFDLILMDIQMPVMDGITATRMIREEEARTGSPHIPIVAMTANAMKGDAEHYLDEGMDDYISKPLRLEELADLMGRIAVSEGEKP